MLSCFPPSLRHCPADHGPPQCSPVFIKLTGSILIKEGVGAGFWAQNRPELVSKVTVVALSGPYHICTHTSACGGDCNSLVGLPHWCLEGPPEPDFCLWEPHPQLSLCSGKDSIRKVGVYTAIPPELYHGQAVAFPCSQEGQ